jgi:hypothetical protein
VALAQRNVPVKPIQPAYRAASSVAYPRPSSQIRRLPAIPLSLNTFLTYIFLLVLLILYVSQFALLEQVSYKRSKLLYQYKQLQTQQELLRGQILRQKNEMNIEQWCKSHGMVLAPAESFNLGVKRD